MHWSLPWVFFSGRNGDVPWIDTFRSDILPAAESWPLQCLHQDALMKTSPVNEDRSLTALINSPSELLALPLAPSLDQTENNNVDDMSAEQSIHLNAYEGTKENHCAPLFSWAHPNMQKHLNYTDAGSLRQKPASDNVILRSNSLGLEDWGSPQTAMVTSIDLEDITTLLSDIHLP